MIPFALYFTLATLMDPWHELRAEFYRAGRREGLTRQQIEEGIRYTILLNERAGWEGPGRRKRR